MIEILENIYTKKNERRSVFLLFKFKGQGINRTFVFDFVPTRYIE